MCTVARLALGGMALHPGEHVVQQHGCRALANLSPLQVPIPAMQCVAAALAAFAGGEAQYHALRALLVLLQPHFYAGVLLEVDIILRAVKEHVALLESGIKRKSTRWPAREQLRGSIQIVLSGFSRSLSRATTRRGACTAIHCQESGLQAGAQSISLLDCFEGVAVGQLSLFPPRVPCASAHRGISYRRPRLSGFTAVSMFITTKSCHVCSPRPASH